MYFKCNYTLNNHNMLLLILRIYLSDFNLKDMFFLLCLFMHGFFCLIKWNGNEYLL